jgi:hypothetical protein
MGESDNCSRPDGVTIDGLDEAPEGWRDVTAAPIAPSVAGIRPAEQKLDAGGLAENAQADFFQ